MINMSLQQPHQLCFHLLPKLEYQHKRDSLATLAAGSQVVGRLWKNLMCNQTDALPDEKMEKLYAWYKASLGVAKTISKAEREEIRSQHSRFLKAKST